MLIYVESTKYGMEQIVYVVKDMLELMEFVEHVHQIHILIKIGIVVNAKQEMSLILQH